MTERQVQVAVAQYMDASPFWRDCWWHTPNERFEAKHAYRLKAEGVKPGVPDILSIKPSGLYVGFAMELKRPKAPPSAISAAQDAWLIRFHDAGWYACIAKGIDEALAELKEYEASAAAEQAHWAGALAP